jgi:hypothetical protein
MMPRFSLVDIAQLWFPRLRCVIVTRFTLVDIAPLWFPRSRCVLTGPWPTASSNALEATFVLLRHLACFSYKSALPSSTQSRELRCFFGECCLRKLATERRWSL